MSTERIKLKDLMISKERKELYLPALQRKLVWKPERIEKLFDSLFRNFPISQFIFWRLDTKIVNKKGYMLYDLITDFDANENYNAKSISPHLDNKNIFVIIDGQQRITALSIGIQGSYTEKNASKKKKIIKKELYFNILINQNKNEIENEEDVDSFRFFSEGLVKNDEMHLWVKLKDLMVDWDPVYSAQQYCKNNNIEFTPEISKNASKINNMLCTDLSYFEIEMEEMSQVLDVFTRLNSGGVQLKPADLIFSQIVADKEDMRENIESIVNNCDIIELDNDLVIKCALAYAGENVKYNIKTIKKCRDEIYSK